METLNEGHIASHRNRIQTSTAWLCVPQYLPLLLQYLMLRVVFLKIPWVFTHLHKLSVNFLEAISPGWQYSFKNTLLSLLRSFTLPSLLWSFEHGSCCEYFYLLHISLFMPHVKWRGTLASWRYCFSLPLMVQATENIAANSVRQCLYRYIFKLHNS